MGANLAYVGGLPGRDEEIAEVGDAADDDLYRAAALALGRGAELIAGQQGLDGGARF